MPRAVLRPGPRRSTLAFRLVWVLMLGLPALHGYGQERSGDAADAAADAYGTGAGLEVYLTNGGFGLGGYYSRAVGPSTSFWLRLGIEPGRDERELKFSNRFGDSIIPDKRNYLLMLPVQAGFQRRLFREHIEENFRPYLLLVSGPVFGWEYPYFEDRDGNDTFDRDVDRRYDALSGLPEGALRMGVGGTVALGAFFGESRRVAQSVRLGFSVTHFFRAIQLLEPTAERSARHTFATPVVSLTFGRLF